MSPTARPSAEALDWAQRLVRFETVSDHSNLPLIECIADHLRSLHIPVRLTWDDDRGKANLFATIGEGRPDGVVLSGHTDTVPWDGQDWHFGPTAGVVQDDRLYARGSADMKGFIGLCVAQARQYQAADLPFAVHFAFSYDEEVGCFGARNLIADLTDAGIAPRLCIVGEPTGMIPAIAHKGVHRWRCCLKGKAAHSSLTPHGVNTIEAGARLVAQIADMADRWRDHGPFFDGFDVAYTTAAVCVMHGGIADNIIPEDTRFTYEFRNLPGTDAEAMQRAVAGHAARLEPRMRAVHADAGIQFESIASIPPFLAPADDPAVLLAKSLAQTDRTTLVPFGTEAGLFQQAGMSTVVCGPGHIEQAHQADEYVSLDQLARCEAFLQRLTTR